MHNEDGSNDPTSENKTENHNFVITRTTTRRLATLINEGVFKNEPGGKTIEVNIKKAEKILSPFAEEEKNKLEIEVGKNEAENALRKSVKAFIDNGIISADVAVTAGKLIRPSNIIKGEVGFLYAYSKSDFPEFGKERGCINTDPKQLSNEIQSLKDKLSLLSLDLTDDQIKEIALRTGLSHEYGHAVKQALEIAKSKQILQNGDQTKPMIMIGVEIEMESNENISTKIAPQPELNEIFKNNYEGFGDRSDINNTSPERVSTGFEILGLRYALSEAGIPEEKIISIIDLVQNELKDGFEDYKKVVEMAKEKGMNINTLGEVYQKLVNGLEEEGKTELIRLIPPPNIGATYAGYFFPLNENQLKEYVESFENN